MNDAPLTLRVPVDPALGVTIRVFAAECGRRLGLSDEHIDDLRLVVTELLANAVEQQRAELELRIEVAEGRWRVTAQGAGALDEPAQAPHALLQRADLLRAIGDVDAQGSMVSISSSLS